MIQKMKNLVTINVHGVDLTAVTNIEVCFKQDSTELLYTGNDVQVGSETQLLVSIPKSVAMGLNPKALVYGQVMFTKEGDIPDATDVFTIKVRELIKEAGYGN